MAFWVIWKFDALILFCLFFRLATCLAKRQSEKINKIAADRHAARSATETECLIRTSCRFQYVLLNKLQEFWSVNQTYFPKKSILKFCWDLKLYANRIGSTQSFKKYFSQKNRFSYFQIGAKFTNFALKEMILFVYHMSK